MNQSSRDRATAALRRMLLPVIERRWVIERGSYVGTKILRPQVGNDLISKLLQSGRPMAVGKIGNVELTALHRYIRHRDREGLCENWGRNAKLLHMNAGVFPATPVVFSKFARTFGEALGSLDALAVWFQPGENRIRRMLAPRATPIALTALEPYFHERPWTKYLAGKRVLVITPFAGAVASQYPRRDEIWAGLRDVLPNFEIDTLRVPLSAGLVAPEFPDWLTALDSFRQEMTRRSFDIAIVGAGAWGIPLAIHAKSMGRAGIHLGGPTQILFGIRGGRWDHHPSIKRYINDAWVRPSGADRPQTYRAIEDGCYW